MSFPDIRMRNKRKDEATRMSNRQTKELSAGDLIMPIFVKEGIAKAVQIKSMPGICQFPLDAIAGEAQRIYELGIPSVILFGIPKIKDGMGVLSFDDKGIVQEAIRIIKKQVPGLKVVCDVCMCEYTSHGHCGILRKTEQGGFEVDNDKTIEALGRIALSYACAGADMVAPSAMMDGQVKVIKDVLVKNNYSKVKIMAYSVKYASGFYGPFRDAAESPPQFGDRKTYQMDYHNSDEAVEECRLDIEEGADILMVKPALGYQDIIYRLKKELKFPLACYSVSGEYSMIKLAGSKGYLDEKKIVLETLIGFKRAGCDFIITYYAKEIAEWIKKEPKI